jgi:hypothetical protein
VIGQTLVERADEALSGAGHDLQMRAMRRLCARQAADCSDAAHARRVEIELPLAHFIGDSTR